MNIWNEKLPIFEPSEDMKLGEVVIAEGVIDIERRRMTDDDALIDLSDFIGGFKRERGWTNLSIIESHLAHLNGCEVRVKIEILEFPQQDSTISKGERIK